MNEILAKLKTPAIALIVIGVSNFGLSLLAVFSGLLRLTGIGGLNELPMNYDERMGFIVGSVIVYGIASSGLIVGPIIVYGGIQMMNGRKYAFALTAAVLSIVPFISCGFFLSTPIGIWVIYILRDPEVKSFFKGEFQPHNQFQPPTF